MFGFELVAVLIFVSYLMVKLFRPKISLNKFLGHPEYEPLGSDDGFLEPEENRLWRMSPDPDRALVSVADTLLAAADDPAVNWTTADRADARRVASEVLAQVARPAHGLAPDQPSARLAAALELLYQMRETRQ